MHFLTPLPYWLVLIFVSQLVNSIPFNDYMDDDDRDDDEQKDEQTDLDDRDEIVELWSKGGTIYAHEGSTVVLPCDLSDPDHQTFNWNKGNVTIFTNVVRLGVHSKKLSVATNKSLIIPNVEPSDEDSYKCVVYNSNQHNLEAVYTLRISRTPEINVIKTSTGHTHVQIGTTLQLLCYATGSPTPTISWSTNGQKLSNHLNSSSITIENINISHSGDYQCVADNHVGQPAHKAIRIKVLYKPHIKIDKLVVNSAEDYESQLICTANAEPKPKIYWVKDNKIIKSDDRVKVMEINDSLILQIRKTQGSDFGDYTCLAQNRLGKAEQTASLTDRPAFVKFQQTESSPDGRSITLVWLVESVAPIVKYELMVKSRKSKKWWITNPQVRNPRNSDSFYEVRAELTNLEFGEYEVKLMSENVNGWTEFSQVHSFRHPDDRENMISDQQEIVAGNALITKLSSVLMCLSAGIVLWAVL